MLGSGFEDIEGLSNFLPFIAVDIKYWTLTWGYILSIGHNGLDSIPIGNYFSPEPQNDDQECK